MPLQPGDLMFVGWDADNNDIAFVTTVDLVAGDVIYFTDDEWNGTAFNGSEQLFEWTVPAGGVAQGTLVTIDMVNGPADASFDSGGAVDYIRGGGLLARGNEMFWAFQGTRVGNTVTPTDFIAVIANEADGNSNQTPNLSGTGLTTSNGAIIIDGDEDYMEFTADGTLSNPVARDDLIATISNLANWTTADGGGNNNPNGTGFDVSIPDVVCFVGGTLIETPHGVVPVERIRPGDMVLTLDNGPQQVKWVGRRSISLEDVRNHAEFAPVRIMKNAFGPGLPNEDLLVSPQHRIRVSSPRTNLLFGLEECLAPAIGLVNGRTIRRHAPTRAFQYVHILFEAHEVIWSNALLTESFLPAEGAIGALDDQARHEVFGLFPALRKSHFPHEHLARPTLTRREATLL